MCGEMQIAGKCISPGAYNLKGDKHLAKKVWPCKTRIPYYSVNISRGTIFTDFVVFR